MGGASNLNGNVAAQGVISPWGRVLLFALPYTKSALEETIVSGSSGTSFVAWDVAL